MLLDHVLWLKNVGTTYQRLVNIIFKDHISTSMKVYLDDMLVKSQCREDHIFYLSEPFKLLKKYQRKLNFAKKYLGGVLK